KVHFCLSLEFRWSDGDGHVGLRGQERVGLSLWILPRQTQMSDRTERDATLRRQESLGFGLLSFGINCARSRSICPRCLGREVIPANVGGRLECERSYGGSRQPNLEAQLRSF